MDGEGSLAYKIIVVGDLKDTIAAYDRLDFRVNTADVPTALTGIDLCIASVDR